MVSQGELKNKESTKKLWGKSDRVCSLSLLGGCLTSLLLKDAIVSSTCFLWCLCGGRLSQNLEVKNQSSVILSWPKDHEIKV